MDRTHEIAFLKRIRQAHLRIVESINQQILLLEHEVLPGREQRRKEGVRRGHVESALLRPYIKEWLDQGFTIKSLAEKAEVSRESIDHIMQGRHNGTQVGVAERILIMGLGLPHVWNELVPWEDTKPEPFIPEPPFRHFDED